MTHLWFKTASDFSPFIIVSLKDDLKMMPIISFKEKWLNDVILLGNKVNLGQGYIVYANNSKNIFFPW